MLKHVASGSPAAQRGRALVLCAAAAVLGAAHASSAQTWNGGSASNSNWSTGGVGGNWSGAAAPVNNGTASVILAGSTRLTPNVDVAWNISGLLFNVGASSFILTGQPLTLQSGGLSNLSNTTQTINNALVIGASQTWFSGGGQGSISGPTLAVGANTLTFGGSGNQVLTASVSGTGALVVAMNAVAGTVFLGGSLANPFSGTVAVNNGTLQLNKPSLINALSGPLVIGDGTGAASSAIVNHAAIGQLTTSTDVTIRSDGILNVIGGTSSTFRALNMSGGTVSIGNGSLGLSGDVTVTGDVGSVITATDGSADLGLSNSARTFNVADGAAKYDLDLAGAGIASGTLVKTGLGTLRLSADGNPNFAVTLQQGTLAVGTNNSLGGGTLTLAGGTVQADGNSVAVAMPNPVALTGNVTIASPFQPSTTNINFIGNVVVTGPRTLTVTNKNLTFLDGGVDASSPGASLTIAGTPTTEVVFGGGAISGTITNNVSLEMFDGVLSGTLVNTAGATFQFDGGTFNGVLDNSGILVLPSSFLAGNGYISRVVSLVSAGNSIGANGIGTGNEAELFLSGGTLIGAGPITNNAVIDGSGTIAGTGGLVNNGYLSPGGPIALTNTGTNVNFGTIALQLNKPLQLFGSGLTNRGSITLANATLPGTAPLVNAAGGSITGVGLISAPFTNAPGGTVYVASGTVSVLNPFGNAGTLQLGSPAASLSGGAIANTGTIQGLGIVGNAVNNTSGTVEAIGGTLGIYGGLTNAASGTLAVGAGAKLLVNPGLAVNAGLISLTGGTYDNGGAPLNNTGSITGYGIFRTGGAGLTNNGAITLTGGNTTVNGPVTNAANHNVRVQYNPATFTGFFQNNGFLYVTSTTASFAAGQGGNVGMGAPPGGGGLSAGTSASLGGGGSTIVSPGASLITDGMTQGSLIVQGTPGSYGQAHFTTREPSGVTPVTGRAAGQSISVLGTLSIATDGIPLGNVDLADNDLILTATPELTIRNYIASWYQTGTRAARGLSSSFAGVGSGPDALATLAVITNSDGRGGALFSTFDGISVASTDVLVKYTYLGDTNLDGLVDGADLANLLAGMNGQLTGWVNGDVNYDGTVNGADLTLLLSTLRNQFAPFGTSGSSGGAVPEPASLLFVAPALGLLRRRRRR